MASGSTDEYESSYDETYVRYDSDSEETEDQIEDPQDNDSFDRKLIEAISSEPPTIDVPTQFEPFGNEETSNSDSGIEDTNSLCSQEVPVEVEVQSIFTPVSVVLMLY